MWVRFRWIIVLQNSSRTWILAYFKKPSTMSAGNPPCSSLCLDVSHVLGSTIKGLEVAIKNPKKKYQDKVSALLSGWERLASVSNASPGSVSSLAECLYRDTLTLVLKGHWPKLSPATKTHLSVTLQRCVGSLINHSALKKCRDLIGLVNNPWGHPTLTGILNKQEGISDSDVVEFCLSEKESMIFMRLETLCDSKCEDLALNLARACVQCLRSADTRFRDACTQEERYCILDLYIILLYKFKNVQEIINELKHLDLREGLALIRRHSATKDVKNLPRVYKNSHKVAELAAQYFLAVAMVKSVAETVGLLKDLVTEWVILHCRDEAISENLANMIRKLVQPAESALHVYIFIEVLVDKFGYSLKSLCIELYVRGLAMDMNELEHQKVVGDEEKVKEIEVRLSYGFLKLADILKDKIDVARECLLTAFSLYPTDKTYQQLREMAIASGKLSSSPVFTRKRKTKITLIRYREQRTCKSIYRKKLKVVECESYSVSPVSSSIPKKHQSELCGGDVPRFARVVSETSFKSTSVKSKESNPSNYCQQNKLVVNRNEHSQVSNARRDLGESCLEVSRLPSQEDVSSNAACLSNTRIPNANGVPSVSPTVYQKDLSMDSSTPLRSRSGSLTETNTTLDDLSCGDADSGKRSRSSGVAEGSLSRKLLPKRLKCRSIYRSLDDASLPSELHSADTPKRCSTKSKLYGNKCFCIGCGEKGNDSSGLRRSKSYHSLHEESLSTENEPPRLVLSSDLRATSPSKRPNKDSKFSSEKQLETQLPSIPSPEHVPLDDTEFSDLSATSRLRSRHGSSSSDNNFFKESKARLIRSSSGTHEVSAEVGNIEVGRSKSLIPLDIAINADSCASASNVHRERCKAFHGNDSEFDEAGVAANENPQTYSENSKSCVDIESCCKICSHPHLDTNNRTVNRKSSLCTHTKKVNDVDVGEHPSQLSESSNPLNYDVLSAPNEVLNADKLGLTSQLCDDLAVVLSGPRWHMLSWMLDWSHLSSLCERYLKDRDGMRNVTKELKYLNIDYSQFKDKPVAGDSREEYSGIEKGYEQWADVGSEHSDSEFTYSPSHKKSNPVQCNGESDSDSSGISNNQKASLNSPISSQSDSDLKAKNRRKQTFRTLSMSDSDTGTQDSRTESLGSDGCYKEQPKRKVPDSRRKKIPLVKRIAEKRLKNKSKITLIVNEEICKKSNSPREISSDSTEVMTIFSELEENGRNQTSKQYSNVSYSAAGVNINNTTERREKDSTLKSLRMFRPNHLKPFQDRICFSSANDSSKKKEKANDEGIKFAPMLSTLNLNPRILLTRADVSSHYIKSKNFSPVIVKNTALNSQQSTKGSGISKGSQCLGEKKCIFSSGRKNNFSKNQRVSKKLDGLRPDFEMITQVMDSQLLARSVPGLNSLDMMVPPPSEPTVQVIQVPHNPPHTTSATNSSGSVNTTQKVTTTQGVQTTPAISQKITTTQGVQTVPVNAASQKSTFTQGVQISPPMRSSGTGEPGPSSLTRADERWQSTRLNVTSSDSATSHTPPTLSSSSAPGEETLAGVVMETRYFTPSNITSSVSSGTPVTAHIQRVGQPPVGLDGDSVLAAPLRRLPQCPPQLMSGTQIPLVKSVNLDTVASLRAESVRSSDGGDALSANLGVQRSLQVGASLDAQKVHIITKKDAKSFNLTSLPSCRSSADEKIKNTRVQKVDEDSQTEDIVHSTGVCSVNEDTGGILVMEDGVPKLVGTGRKQQLLKVMKSSASQVASLPKFQQAFGKTIYSSNSPGTVDSAVVTPNANIQGGPGCVHQGSVVAAEKLDAPAVSGSVLSKGVQTSDTKISSPTKNCAIESSPSTSLPASVKTGSTEVSQQVPVLCAIQTVSSVATQSDPTIGSGSAASKFPPPSSSTHVVCSSPALNAESSPLSQKIPLVTAAQAVAALCEAHQTSQQQIAIPMKLSMVSLAASLNDKELLLRSKMTELLNRALARNIASANCSSVSSASSDVSGGIRDRKSESFVSSSSDESGSDSMESSNDQEDSRISNSENVRCIIQSRVTRTTVEIPVEENAVSSVGPHAVILQSTHRSQQPISGHVPSVLCSTTNNTAVTSHVSPTVESSSNLIPHNAIHPAVSSTTLEQLREFESVLEQVTNTSQMKERKSVLPQSENETTNDLTQQLLLSQTSTPTNSTDFDSSNTPSTSFSRESFPSSPPTTSPKGSSVNFGSQTSGIQGSIASSRISSTTPVVVVTTYSQPVASPALSVTSQSSSSPNVTPASTPGKTPPKSSPKSSKSKSMKAAPTTTSKTTPVTKPQQKPQEDEETAQRIYAILDQYAEQLKNSPDLINKPAPRRRSNPPINPIGSSKRKKSTPTKLRLSGHPPVLSESSPGGDDPRTAGSEDSSSGITQLTQVHDSPATIPSNSDDTSALESPHTFQIRRALSGESGEPREVNRTSRGTETTGSNSSATTPPEAVTPEPGSGVVASVSNTTPSSTGAVVAGKSLVVGSATALPLYVPGSVRQVLFPVASGLTASMQGRPVVVTKGSKVIRVHQVTVAGGSPMLAGTVAGAKPLQVSTGAGAVQGALVVRQMCVNKTVVSSPSVSAPQMSPLTMVGTSSTAKQLKLPVMQAVAGGISSQTLTGVTAQPPVVLPPGSHTLSTASFLPPNLKTVQVTPESSKESVGTSTAEDETDSEDVNTSVNQDADLVTVKVESEELVNTSVTPSKTESLVERELIKREPISPDGSVVTRMSSVGCKTEPLDDTCPTSIAPLNPDLRASPTMVKIDVDFQISMSGEFRPKFKIKDEISSDASISPSSKRVCEETSARNSPSPVLAPQFHDTVLVDASLSGKVGQRSAKDDGQTALQTMDSFVPGNPGMMGIIGRTVAESSKDGSLISKPEQSVAVGSSMVSKDNSADVERVTEQRSTVQQVCSRSVGSDCNRRPSGSQGGGTVSAGPQGPSFMTKDSQDRIHIHHSPGNGPPFNRELKRTEFPLEGQLLHEALPPMKDTAVPEKEKPPQPPSQSKPVEESSSLQTSMNPGKNLVLDVCVPKVLVPTTEQRKAISTENKSCEERSSEDELERKLSRTLSAANSSEYCFPVKRPLADGKASDSPWRYVPVVKRVSVCQTKAVSVDSALLRSHVESEACLNLPRMTDSIPDELKEGESDDSCRPNFTPSIEGTHSTVKRRLFGDDVLEYSTYPAAKKSDKLKQRVEKISRVPDAIETRLELEKELRLQKSLSEECEDLGVDEPSTSDLFPEADLLLDPNPSPTYDQTMPDTSCAQNVDSSEPFSSSDFRSVDSSSSAEGVHESAGCSKTLSLPGSKSLLRKEKPNPMRPRKYLLRHRGDKKKWVSVRNHHGSLEYRKVTKDDEKRPILQRSPRGNAGELGTGSLNGSKTISQSSVNITNFSSSSGEDSLSQHPPEAAVHTTTPTFSSDMTYSSPQDDTAASPNSPSSQTHDIPPAPTAAQKFNITYGKKCQTYGKDYCRRGTKRPKVCRFINYLCDQGDSRDTCDSWESSNSVEKESTSESSKCGRTYGIMKETRSPSTSPEEDDDGKSIPDFQETTANHSFNALLPISATSKLPKENVEDPVIEGIEDDNAILPPVNGIESDDEKNTQKRNALGKSLRKHVMEKNAKKILDKIDLYPRVCLKKWKGNESITCSRYSLELESVSSAPTGSKHFSCIDRPLLESESSVSSEPSSENSSKTSIEPSISVGHIGLSKSLVLSKDGELNLQSECPNASGLMKSSLRRSSLRGHVKKGCPCCNGSPEPKKARGILKGEKLSKKGHPGKQCSKLHLTKKR
ncbi:uncharacterized protein LOC124171566 isoform X2 [Ischnura elegans]|uniref:uncharacterized protein LOC124171566 isoform X2 n=1 Tax=Ischnura elegans TaxID=197161 RepID=UPI001ED87F29|nr:uncharacterized protein LOC124171566 isoform X2 [Ischnura elegans]